MFGSLALVALVSDRPADRQKDRQTMPNGARIEPENLFVTTSEEGYEEQNFGFICNSLEYEQLHFSPYTTDRNSNKE